MKELKYITMAQIIGCLLVIWGHSYPFVTDMPLVVLQGKTFIYLFHMPLFIFCSGYLFAFTKQIERKTFFEYVGQRAKKLLIPYFVLSLIGLLPKYLFSSVLNDTLHLDTLSLIRAFLVPRENIWGHFWFLPMIFFLGIIAYLIEKYMLVKTNKTIGWGIVTLVLMAVSIFFKPTDSMGWFGINDLILYGWSYALGVSVFFLLGDLKESVRFKGWQTTIFCLVGGGISVLISILGKEQDYQRVLVALLMISVVLIACVALDDIIRINRRSLIAQTYQIFILSWPCQLIVEIILERVLHLQWWIILPSVFCSGVIGPVLLIKAINHFERKTRTHYLSLIIGK